MSRYNGCQPDHIAADFNLVILVSLQSFDQALIRFGLLGVKIDFLSELIVDVEFEPRKMVTFEDLG